MKKRLLKKQAKYDVKQADSKFQTDVTKEPPVNESRQNLTTEKADKTAKAVKAEKVSASAPEKKTAVPEKKIKNAETVKSTVLKPSIVYQFGNIEINKDDVIAAVKKEWTGTGNKIKDIKTLDCYIKAEEQTVYYIVNETEKGSIAL